MTQDEPSPEDHWEQDREELRWLARLHLSPRLRGKVDPSDIVQQTLLQAYERRHQCRGQNGAERTGWLRRILANTLADALRTFGLAQHAWEAGGAERVRELLGQTGQELLSLKGTADLWSVAFSPDGKRLASGSGGYGEQSIPGEVKVWDA
jgi:DNA-directed RNA polymerase specialized sigma24 family protein